MVTHAAGLLAVLTLLGPPPAQAQSVGHAWNGQLRDGVAMELRGSHHRFTGNVGRKASNFGTAEMVALMRRTAATVDFFVDGPPMVLGSISREDGGRMNPHKSHQTGRDVDILFYMVAPDGRRRQAKGFYEFDAEGRCQHRRCQGWRFDVQRNWWLVRTLVWSQRPQVQWIFVSRGLRKIMLDYAVRRQEHPEILRRARRMLQQPGNSSPHADHFHVRIYCSPTDRAAGCEDGGPRWPWARRAAAR